MAFTLDEIKDLISFGQDIGLQQLQTEGLVVVYGHRASTSASPVAAPDNTSQDDTMSILAHYSAVGRGKTGKSNGQ